MIARVGRVYRAAFAGLPRDVWLLAGATLVNRAGAMVLPFLGLYVTTARGLPASAAATVLMAYGVGMICGSWLGGQLCARLGPLRVMQGSLLAAGVVYLFIPRTPDLFWLVVVVALASTMADAFRPAVMSAVADAAPAAVRTRSLALIRLAANLGFAIGPSAGGLLAGLDYTYLFVGDALTCWLAAGVVHLAFGRRRGRTAASRPVARGDASAAYRDPAFLALLAIVFVFTLALFQSFATLPLYLHDAYGFSERAIGLLLGFNGLLIALFEMVLVQRVEALDPLRVVATGAVLLCGGLALLPLGRSAAFVALSIATWTVGEMLVLPLTNALAAGRGRGAQRGPYMGLYSAVFAAAFVVAPLIGVHVLQRFGGAALWFGIGLLGPALAAGALALRRLFDGAAAPGAAAEEAT